LLLIRRAYMLKTVECHVYGPSTMFFQTVDAMLKDDFSGGTAKKRHTCFQAGWASGSGQVLRERGIREAVHAHITVRPRLMRCPLNGVIAITVFSPCIIKHREKQTF